MELGQKIKEARLQAGLSQRQLCGEEITRNMLSQIENGSARPSMTTLQYLASRLGVSVSYFLEEQAVTSPNQQVMEKARSAGDPGQIMELLADYQGPDPVFDRERWLLEALSLLELAEQALAEGKPVYAMGLLERAKLAGENTDYYTQELERRRLLFQFRADPEKASALARQLPDLTQELLLRAKAALDSGDPIRCGLLLDAAAPTTDGFWHFLRGEAYFAQENYGKAAERYALAEEAHPRKAVRKLEECYRELGDFEKAYFYACKARQLEG